MINIVGNYVEQPKTGLNPHTSKYDIIFVGKMSYDPNIIAVEYFVGKIFPKIREIIPETQFTIVGANPTQRVLKLKEVQNVCVTGFVEDIAPFYKNSTILIAPMLSGAGIQNKLIQGMAFGCCIATSSIGAEGLNINGEIAIYDTDDQWIEGIVHLLKCPEVRKEMGQRAYEYIGTHLSIHSIRKQFQRFIKVGIEKQQQRVAHIVQI